MRGHEQVAFALSAIRRHECDARPEILRFLGWGDESVADAVYAYARNYLIEWAAHGRHRIRVEVLSFAAFDAVAGLYSLRLPRKPGGFLQSGTPRRATPSAADRAKELQIRKAVYVEAVKVAEKALSLRLREARDDYTSVTGGFGFREW